MQRIERMIRKYKQISRSLVHKRSVSENLLSLQQKRILSSSYAFVFFFFLPLP